MGSDNIKGRSNMGVLVDPDVKLGLKQVALDRSTADEPVKLSDITREALAEWIVDQQDTFSESALDKMPDTVVSIKERPE